MRTKQNSYTGNLGNNISNLALDVNQNVHAKETLERYTEREEEKNKALLDFKNTYATNKTTPINNNEDYKDALRDLKQKIVNLQLSITTTLAPAMKYLYRNDEEKWQEEREKIKAQMNLLENELIEVNHLMREHNINQPATIREAVTATTTQIKNAVSSAEEAVLSKFRQKDGDVYCTQKELTYYKIGPNGKPSRVTCDFQLSADQMDRAIERWNTAHPDKTIGPRKNNFLTTGWRVETGSEERRSQFMMTMKEIHDEDLTKKKATTVTQATPTPAANPAPAAANAPQTPAANPTAQPAAAQQSQTAGNPPLVAGQQQNQPAPAPNNAAPTNSAAPQAKPGQAATVVNPAEADGMPKGVSSEDLVAVEPSTTHSINKSSGS